MMTAIPAPKLSSDWKVATQLHDEAERRAGGFRAAGDVDVDVVAFDAVAEKRVDPLSSP
ncbi:hypothetical protein ACGFYQ_39830 [Streptomyces sp. NPDC048258]|uniref:hypothetical protein n=1 Tax=Streptomyces sp. NPDC048258 TaxID=3365527 RepID=UPI003722CF30